MGQKDRDACRFQSAVYDDIRGQSYVLPHPSLPELLADFHVSDVARQGGRCACIPGEDVPSRGGIR